MKLTARARRNLPGSVFALPGRRFPIHDKVHARVAKSYASRMAKRGQLSPQQRAAVFAKANRMLGLRRAMGGGVYDLVDAQRARQDEAVQAQNREDQPRPGSMAQAQPGMAGGGMVNLARRAKAMKRFLAGGPKVPPRSARLKTAAATLGAGAAGAAVQKATGTPNYSEMGKAGGGMILKALRKPAMSAGKRWMGKLRSVTAQVPEGPARQTATGERLKLRQQRVRENPAQWSDEWLDRGKVYPGAQEQSKKALKGATATSNREQAKRLGSKYGATKRAEGMEEIPFARGGKLSAAAIKKIKPFRAKGKITPNDPPVMMRGGGRMRAHLRMS